MTDYSALVANKENQKAAAAAEKEEEEEEEDKELSKCYSFSTTPMTYPTAITPMTYPMANLIDLKPETPDKPRLFPKQHTCTPTHRFLFLFLF